jgi:hypothetical protein
MLWDITPCRPLKVNGPALTMLPCSALTLKMEAICSSETSGDFQRTTRPYIPEDSALHNHRCENLRSCVVHSHIYIKFTTWVFFRNCFRLQGAFTDVRTISYGGDAVLPHHLQTKRNRIVCMMMMIVSIIH